jgi:ATP-dependent helicase/nuclease subunit B
VTGLGLFTIPAGADFAQSLARGLIARVGNSPLTLPRCVIYLPTRRAARSFGEAFAKLLGGAALLPQFRALGDSEEDELAFDAVSEGLDLPPAIDPIRRQLLLAALVRRWDAQARGGSLSVAQSLALADSLAALMDEIERQGVSLGGLAGMAPPALAAHWRDVVTFLDLIRTEWPKILEEEGQINPGARRNAALALLTERLAKQAPADGGMVIAAGSTGSIPATARFLAAIAALPNGAVVLPGLDRELDEKSWNDLDPGHPQFGIKHLLEQIGGARDKVPDWDGGDSNPERSLLLREALRPAPTTDAWRALADRGEDAVARGLDGLSLIAANDPAEEALAIALALRHALETQGRTAALVTPDRNLARRVAAELTRWDIAIDDSAGRPLAHTSAGAFLSLVAEAAEAKFAPVPLLALLKHPFATLGAEPGPFRAQARLLDKYVLRGARPDPGLAGIAKAIAAARTDRRKPGEKLTALARWWAGIAAILAPLENIFAQQQASPNHLIQVHLTAAEKLSCSDAKACPLWRGPDGEAAAELFNALLAAVSDLPEMEPSAWPILLRTLAMKAQVRTAPRRRAIAILGPLEARLQRFDLTILGGLNEGTWPAAVPADPWFSRPMRKALGLEQPERRMGLAAHDFAGLAAGPQVLLTRAQKAEGTPTIASRWLQRLTQLTRGLGLDEKLTPAMDYLSLARSLWEVTPERPIARPAPKPPVEARPRRLSVTEIETWLRDPYAIYARHVLKLKPLELLDQEIGALERGTALHRALEIFIRDYPDALPPDAVLQLTARADLVFAQLGVPNAALALWRPRFLGAAQWFVAFERERRRQVTRSHLEIRGSRTFGGFELTGIADRIDILKSGGTAIIDYKTGRPPSGPQIKELLAPQLPLEGAILAAGGFPGLGKLAAQELLYLRLSGGADGNREQPVDDPVALAIRAAEKLEAMVALFGEPGTPYLSRLRPFSAHDEGDYDHLARVREWAPSGWSEET